MIVIFFLLGCFLLGSLPRWHWQCRNGIEQLLLVLRSLFAFAATFLASASSC